MKLFTNKSNKNDLYIYIYNMYKYVQNKPDLKTLQIFFTNINSTDLSMKFTMRGELLDNLLIVRNFCTISKLLD